jgi:WD40 repeat protein
MNPTPIPTTTTTTLPRITPIQTITASPEERCWYLSFCPNNNDVHNKKLIVATCGADKTVRLFKSNNNNSSNNNTIFFEPSTLLEDGHSRTIRMCEFSPNGKYLATCSFDGTTVIWVQATTGGSSIITSDDREWTAIRTLQGHENEVKGLAWNCTGTLLATCGRDKKIWIWIVPESLLSGNNNTHNKMSNINDDDDDNMDDTNNDMGNIIVDTSNVEWDCAAILSGHQGDVKRICFHPNEDLLASASYDDTIRLWCRDPTIQDWVCISTLTGHSNTVWDCKFIHNPNTGQDLLISCSQDLTMNVWLRHVPALDDDNSKKTNSLHNDNNNAVVSMNIDKLDEEMDDISVLNALNSTEGDGGEQQQQQQRTYWALVTTFTTPHWRTIYSLDWLDGMLITCGGDDSIILYEFNPNTSFNIKVLKVIDHAHDMDVNCVRFIRLNNTNNNINNSKEYVFGSVGDDGLLKLYQVVV